MMDEETNTVVTIETHTRTVIRRSRRAVEIVSEPILVQPQLPAVKNPSRLAAATRTICNRLGKSFRPRKRLTNGKDENK